MESKDKLIMSYELSSYFQKKRLRRETITDLKTYEEAETICIDAFQASKSYQTCQEYVTDLSNTSLVNCISDVMVGIFFHFLFFIFQYLFTKSLKSSDGQQFLLFVYLLSDDWG